MPDISICTNADCPLSYNCWTFNAPHKLKNQSYVSHEPELVDDEYQCKFFIDMDEVE